MERLDAHDSAPFRLAGGVHRLLVWVVGKAKAFPNQRVRKGKDGEVDEAERAKNRNKSKIRARVEHVFAVVKRLWGFAKVRYQGLAKNATRSWFWARPTSIWRVSASWHECARSTCQGRVQSNHGHDGDRKRSIFVLASRMTNTPKWVLKSVACSA